MAAGRTTPQPAISDEERAELERSRAMIEMLQTLLSQSRANVERLNTVVNDLRVELATRDVFIAVVMANLAQAPAEGADAIGGGGAPRVLSDDPLTHAAGGGGGGGAVAGAGTLRAPSNENPAHVAAAAGSIGSGSRPPIAPTTIRAGSTSSVRASSDPMDASRSAPFATAAGAAAAPAPAATAAGAAAAPASGATAAPAIEAATPGLGSA